MDYGFEAGQSKVLDNDRVVTVAEAGKTLTPSLLCRAHTNTRTIYLSVLD